MIIKYINNREDYIKAYEKSRKLSLKASSIQLILCMIAITGLCWYFIYEMSSFYNIELNVYLMPLLILGVIATVTIILLNKMSKKNIEKVVDKLIELKSDTLVEKSIEIKEDKILYKGNNVYGEYNIKAIDNIYETSDILVLYIQRINPIIIIPCKAFEDENFKSEFIKIIKEKSNYIK